MKRFLFVLFIILVFYSSLNCLALGMRVDNNIIFSITTQSKMLHREQNNISINKTVPIIWTISDIKYLSDSKIELNIILYGIKKKDAYYQAECAAIKTLLFDGVGKGLFAKPLLSQGENIVNQLHFSYFQTLYSSTYQNFISSCEMIGEYKKADNNKGTKFRVVVKALSLRRDLENHRIRTQLEV